MSEKLKTVTNNILLLTKCKNMVYISNTEGFLFYPINIIFNESEDGTDKKTNFISMLIGAGGTGSVYGFIQPMPFWNLVVIAVGVIIAISIISYSIHAILNSDKKSRNLDGIISAGAGRKNNHLKPKNKASPNERKNHH